MPASVVCDGAGRLAEAEPARLRVLELDVTDEETLSRAAEAVGPETAALQLIINVAGGS